MSADSTGATPERVGAETVAPPPPPGTETPVPPPPESSSPPLPQTPASDAPAPEAPAPTSVDPALAETLFMPAPDVAPAGAPAADVTTTMTQPVIAAAGSAARAAPGPTEPMRAAPPPAGSRRAAPRRPERVIADTVSMAAPIAPAAKPLTPLPPASPRKAKTPGRRRNRLVWASVITVSVLLVAAVAAVIVATRYYTDRVHPGITLAGHDLSGMTAAEVQATVQDLVHGKQLQVTLTGPETDDTLLVDPGDVGLTVDAKATAQAALDAARGVPFLTVAPWRTKPIHFVTTTDPAQAEAWVQTELASRTRASVDATVHYDEAAGQFVTTPAAESAAGAEEAHVTEVPYSPEEGRGMAKFSATEAGSRFPPRIFAHVRRDAAAETASAGADVTALMQALTVALDVAVVKSEKEAPVVE